MLATINTVDFLYACESHLTDPGFATRVGESGDGVGAGAAKMGLSPEEIAKVKAEWEERQKRKQDKEKDKEKEKDKDKDKKDEGKAKNDSEGKSPSSKPVSPPTVPATPAAPPPPAHQRYTLHRNMFAMRLAEHRRRKEAQQAQALAPLFPSTPHTSIPKS